MPAGDGSRAWFPQMIENLKKNWKLSMSWEEYAVLARDMTDLRTKIRKKKGILSPRMFCKGCGRIHGMDPLPIGIRSILFALRKAELLDDDHFSHLDNEWKKYQRLHRLDCHGNPKEQNKSLLPTGTNPANSTPKHPCRPAAE